MRVLKAELPGATGEGRLRAPGRLPVLQTIQSGLAEIAGTACPEGLLLTKKVFQRRRTRSPAAIFHRRKRFSPPCKPYAFLALRHQPFSGRMPCLIRADAREKDAGRKLKYFVRGDLGVSYTQFPALKMSGGVRVNGEAAQANYIAQSRRRGGGALSEDAPAAPCAGVFASNVVFENDDFYIVDKPAPLPCQCSQRQDNGHAGKPSGGALWGEVSSFALSTGWTRAPAGCCAPPNTPTPVSSCKGSCIRAGLSGVSGGGGGH